MKCGEVISLMVGVNRCILIKNECGEVITSINPFCLMTNRAKWAFKKNVRYIRANKKDVISIYIDAEDKEHGN